jgi:hypothetical protein
MAILPAIALDYLIPAVDEGRQLGISPLRIRVLAADEILPAKKLAGRWFVERSAVERRLHEPRLAGRPLSQDMA